MHASDCAKLFTLFTKISDTRVSNPAGSGLGIAICKQLVTLMGGSINVTSEYGSGSKFAYSIGFRKCSDDELRTPTSTAPPYRLPPPLFVRSYTIGDNSGKADGSVYTATAPTAAAPTATVTSVASSPQMTTWRMPTTLATRTTMAVCERPRFRTARAAGCPLAVLPVPAP